jgi:hypothetical protein
MVSEVGCCFVQRCIRGASEVKERRRRHEGEVKEHISGITQLLLIESSPLR